MSEGSAEMKKIKHNIPYLMLATCNVLCFISKETLGFYAKWILLVLPIIMIISFQKANWTIKGDKLIIAGIMLFSVAFFIFGSKGIGSILNLLFLCEIITCFSTFQWNRGDVIYTGICCIVLNVYYFINSIGYTSLYYQMISNDVYVSEINPNTIGLVILFSCMLACVSLTYLRSKVVCAITTSVVLAISLITLWRFSCRGTIIALLFFIIMSYLIPQKVYSRKLLKFLFWVVVFLSVIIPIVYVYLNEKGFSVDVLNMGKSFYSGREIIWKKLFDYAKDNPISLFVGVGSQNTVFSDMHSTIFGLVVNYGIIVTVLVYILFYNMFTKSIMGEINKKSLLCCLAFISILIASWTEATIYFSPAYFFYAMYIAWGTFNSEKGWVSEQ